MASLAWALLGLGRGVVATFRVARDDPWREEAPVRWARQGRHVARLEELLERSADRIPPGSRVVVHMVGEMPEDQGFYLTRWAAYLWPDREVMWSLGSPIGPDVDARLVLGSATPRAPLRVLDSSGSLSLLVPDGRSQDPVGAP